MKVSVFLVLLASAMNANAQCNPYSDSYYDCEMWGGPSAAEKRSQEEDRQLLREIAQRERIEARERGDIILDHVLEDGACQAGVGCGNY